MVMYHHEHLHYYYSVSIHYCIALYSQLQLDSHCTRQHTAATPAYSSVHYAALLSARAPTRSYALICAF
jgi:hypothetical protein